MKNKSSTFPWSFTRLKSVYIPPNDRKLYHPFIHCLILGLQDENITRLLNWSLFDIQSLSLREEGKDSLFFANFFKVNIAIYAIKKKTEWATVEKECVFPESSEYSKTISFFTYDSNWCLLKKNYKGKLKALNRIKCGTCFNWIYATSETKFKREHFKSCRQCLCGRAYQLGDVHPTLCSKVSKKKKRIDYKPNPLQCRMYKAAKEPNYDCHNHHADFECFPTKNGRFVVDSCGLYNSETKKVHLWCGKKALSKFFSYIFDHLQGILWFFNGGKFDNFFLLEYCIREGIPINREKSLIQGNTVYILCLYTKKSMIIIKDLARFLRGSLAFNCKSFGIAKDKSKTDFDHEKVKSWEDVKTYSKERLEYLKMDVISQHEVYLTAAENIWEDYKINLSDFVSLAHLSYAASTTFILPGRL